MYKKSAFKLIKQKLIDCKDIIKVQRINNFKRYIIFKWK